MTALAKTLRLYLRPIDGGLLVGAVLGLAAFLLWLPEQHPDATASHELSADLAAERSRQALEASGFDLAGGLTAYAELQRDPELLDSLQADWGRQDVVEALRGDTAERLPAYHWDVRWKEGGENERTLLRTYLTQQGTLFGLETDASRVLARPVDRAALGAALGSPVPDADVLSDSLVKSGLVFVLGRTRSSDSLGAAAVEAAAQLAPRFDWDAIGRGERQRLDDGAATALARYHLQRTVFRGFRLRVDSVRAATRPGVDVAKVYLEAAPYLAQRVRFEVEIASTGALLGLTSTFNPTVEEVAEETEAVAAGDKEAEDDGSNVNISFGSGEVMGVIAGLIYVVIVVTSLIVFIRRLKARAVDLKVALRDGMWGGLFLAGLVLCSSARSIALSVDEFWMVVLILGINVVLTFAGGAFLVFLLSGAMDSVARAVWPEKLATLDMVRRGALRNVPAGLALLRGLFVACILLGGVTLLMMLMPDAAKNFSDEDERFWHAVFVSSAGFAFSTQAFVGLIIGFGVLLGVGSWIYRRAPSAFVVVPSLAVFLVFLQEAPFKVEPLPFYFVFAGFCGLVLASTFWRFDFVTTYVAYILFFSNWLVANGWLVEGSPAWVDAALIFTATGLVLVIALVGLFSGKTTAEVPEYVPAYIEELAQEERLKHELVLAQQVQSSLLPRKMPAVSGVDVAAMCLAAQEVGGDYYDFVEVEPGRLAVMVGDVSGKGIQAAFYMTLTKGFMQTLARDTDSPAEALRRLNTLFCENAPRGTFISMIYGVLDLEARTFTFARAGHNPVILKRSPSQDPELVQPAGMAIGLVAGDRFDRSIEETTLHLRGGDVLVFYTDGFSEAMNRLKEQYGDDRLAQKVGDVGQRTAHEILHAVSEDVHHFVEEAGRHDDMTMVVVKLSSRTNHRAAALTPERAEATA